MWKQNNMKYFLILFVFALFSFPVFAAENTIWQHALDKQTLRCGYVVYEPGFVKDVNTGKVTGYDKDIMESIAKRLEIKLTWVPAGGWGTVVEDIKSNKYDMLCNSYWTNAEVSKYILYTRPTMFQPAFFIARKDDKRFDGVNPLINDPSVSIAAIEDDSPYYISKQKYPKATIHVLPHNFDFSLIANEVASKKSDLAVIDAVTAGQYQEKNPGKIRLILVDNPLQIVPTAFVIPSGETQMKQAIDQSIDEMIMSGELKRIFAKYSKYPHSFYYPTISYQEK
jgi:ABC-type amino acid transport substrate-binding protein